jgi:hypothetical protein
MSINKVLAASAAVFLAQAPFSAFGTGVAPSLPALTTAQILDKNAAARGGLATWKAVQSLSWKGKLGAGGTTYMTVTPSHKLQTKQREEMQLPYVFEFKRPLKSRLELQFSGQTAVQVYDGVSGWKLRPFLGRTGWDPYTSDELAQAAAEPGIDGLLIDAPAKGAKVEADGTEKVEDHDCYKLKITLKNGNTRHAWVDGHSFLDVKVEGAPRRLDGKPHTVEIFQRDFKPEQGLMIPHTLETRVQGMRKLEKIVIDSVTVNPPLADARFTKSQ